MSFDNITLRAVYTANGKAHTLCFHIRIGEILENT